MKDLDLVPHMSDALKAQISGGQFHKLAARMYGFAGSDGEFSETSALAYLGTKLASRRSEYRQIFEGLLELAELSR